MQHTVWYICIKPVGKRIEAVMDYSLNSVAVDQVVSEDGRTVVSFVPIYREEPSFCTTLSSAVVVDTTIANGWICGGLSTGRDGCSSTRKHVYYSK